MTLPYKYPDGRESRHARYKFWGTSLQQYDVALQYRIKGWWRYRWRTVSSVDYYPMGETPFETFLGKLLELADKERDSRNHERKRMMRHRKFLQRFSKLDSE